MNYQEALDYLKNLTKFGMNFGLGRIENLLERLGNPHKHLKIIHVGGTNGKGSTSAMISSMLIAQGYVAGTFTSPHLHSYNERYRINGLEIPSDEIAALITEIRPHLEKMVSEGYEHPTEFEVSTALAFLWFYRKQVDFLVLEVGLGGAIDSTNVALPLVTVITNVAMDHMDYLGHTLSEIARVKSGIIKEGALVVTASQAPEALEVIRSVCSDQRAKLVEVGRDVEWQVQESSTSGQAFNLKTLKAEYQNLKIKLIGAHQVVNAATAVATVEFLAERGFSIKPEAIREGLMEASWPARLEIMQQEPLVLIDGAHNLDGAVALRNALKEVFTYRQLILVIGMLGDKEREKVVAQLAPLASRIIVTRPNSPRAEDWESIGQTAKTYVDDVEVISDISQAVDKAISLAGSEDMVCVTGSLYMVAEARERWVASK